MAAASNPDRSHSSRMEYRGGVCGRIFLTALKH
jgi:hypothetical protein